MCIHKSLQRGGFDRRDHRVAAEQVQGAGPPRLCVCVLGPVRAGSQRAVGVEHHLQRLCRDLNVCTEQGQDIGLARRRGRRSGIRQQRGLQPRARPSVHVFTSGICAHVHVKTAGFDEVLFTIVFETVLFAVDAWRRGPSSRGVASTKAGLERVQLVEGSEAGMFLAKCSKHFEGLGLTDPRRTSPREACGSAWSALT